MKEINPKFGITDGKFRSSIRSALREIFRNTRRKEFLKKVRFKRAGTNHVQCKDCGEIIQFSRKERFTLVSGEKSKRLAVGYEVDHVDGNEVLDLKNLQAYFDSLFYGRLQILCRDCHGRKTKGK